MTQRLVVLLPAAVDQFWRHLHLNSIEDCSQVFPRLLAVISCLGRLRRPVTGDVTQLVADAIDEH